MTVLRLQHVSLTFGRDGAACHALRGVSLDLPAGRMVTVMGPSGSGKTSLLNVSAGFVRPTAGRIELLGHDVAGMTEAALCRLRRDNMGFVFQSLNMLAAMSADDNVELPLVLCGWAAVERKRRVDELLDLAGLSDKRRCYSDELSAGQQQRLAVLRAIAPRPKLVLMDEPTSCLDSHNAASLMNLVEALGRAEQATVLIATHDQAVAARADHVVQLKDGLVVGGN